MKGLSSTQFLQAIGLCLTGVVNRIHSPLTYGAYDETGIQHVEACLDRNFFLSFHPEDEPSQTSCTATHRITMSWP